MADYTGTSTIDVPATTLFAYLADPVNLPEYFPRLTSAQRTTDDQVAVTARIETEDGQTRDVAGEAWLKVTRADQTLTWGSPGPNNYTGTLDLDPIDEGSCRLRVTITTDHTDDHIQTGVDETVSGIKRAAEARHPS